MNQSLYRLPIRFGPIMAGKEIPTCGVGVSIAQTLYLLLHTRYGELRSDRSFGCKIWDIEFDRTIRTSHWIDYLRESLEAAIRQHEPRLRNPKISVEFRAVDHRSEGAPEDYRQLATVTVNATVVETEEPFRFSTQLHVGQLAS
ncbi:GPW/gp25 family protein [Spirosoma litoris]